MVEAATINNHAPLRQNIIEWYEIYDLPWMWYPGEVVNLFHFLHYPYPATRYYVIYIEHNSDYRTLYMPKKHYFPLASCEEVG
jgi:hypothetical protein